MVGSETLDRFIDDLSSSKPAPGGGAVAPLNLALAVSLLEMVIRLSINKKRYKMFADELNDQLGQLQKIRQDALRLIDEDARVFLELMKTYKLDNPGVILLNEKLKQAAAPAIKVLDYCTGVTFIARNIIHKTNKNVVSDIEVAVANLLAAASSAMSNIFINIKNLSDKEESQKILNTNLEKKIEISDACEIILQETESP